MSEVISPKSITQKTRSKTQRLSHAITATSNLRDTLSAFGDDVIKIKDPSQLAQTSKGIPFGLEEGGGNVNPSFSSEFDILKQDSMRFERIPSAEIGVRSSRWKKAIVAGLFSNRLSKRKNPQNENELQFEEIEEGEKRPPFWGVAPEIRNRVSTLSLQLILHEMACFESCVLLGCLIVNALETISYSTKDRTSSNNDNWIFSKLYGSVSSFLLVFTCLGFLIRIDTINKTSLLTMPLLLIPVILLSSSEYLNKAWDLQRHECLYYLKLDEPSKIKVFLTQDCNYYNVSSTKTTLAHQNTFGTVNFMKIFPVVICLLLSLFLFTLRNSFYLINQFVYGNTKASPEERK